MLVNACQPFVYTPPKPTGEVVALDAQFTATLVIDANCVWLEAGGTRHAAIWPYGFRARADPPELLDEFGRVTARQGQKIVFNGGSGGVPHPGKCDAPGDVLGVSRIVSVH
jgi:hypothetical protein